MRAAAGAIALLAALWLLLVSGDWLLRGFGLAGVAFALLWAARYRRAQEALASPDQNYLELTSEGLTLVEQGRPKALAWAETRGVAIDEDRLQVLVLLPDGHELRIEPQYGALALRKLAEIIYQYRTHCDACIAAADG